MIDCDQPFILLDDARAGAEPARLFRHPLRTIVAHTRAGVTPSLQALRHATGSGHFVAGYLSYEAGHALEPRLARLAEHPSSLPLLWFGVFANVERVHAPDLLPDPTGAWTGEPRPRVTRAGYDAAFAHVAEAIRAGDIYQANLSYRADVPVAGHPLALYARLRGAGAAGWGGIVHTGEHWLLSTSPELFFTVEGDTITTRPMKGTAPRAADSVLDHAAAAALAADPKERAENLMIVDLLRNDIARVAEPGSVAVPALFTVETYPTLHTLTSTVTGRLAAGRDAVDALTALFPCGSVTGAPKIRAQEIIGEAEPDARDAYTGSIGWIGPDGDAAFNVAIRTLQLPAEVARRGHGVATLGLGSAVVADSTAAAEWRECGVKAAFVTRDQQPFELLETMRYLPGTGFSDRALHLSRLTRSAAILGFDPGRADAALHAFDHPEPARVRLALARDGTVTITAAPIPSAPQIASAVLAPLPVDAADFRLRHKTTDRAFYDQARTEVEAFEVLFVRPDGRVTEGSFTNLFVERNGHLLTPPASDGLLPGILRARLLAEGRAREAPLTPEDLAGGFLIGNALRGLIPARLIASSPRP